MHIGYYFLALSILTEVVATRFFKSSNGLTKLLPSLLAFAFINPAYACLAVTLRTKIPLSIAYGIWSGVGIVLISLIDVALGQQLDVLAIVGLMLIVVGVALVSYSNYAATQ